MHSCEMRGTAALGGWVENHQGPWAMVSRKAWVDNHGVPFLNEPRAVPTLYGKFPVSDLFFGKFFMPDMPKSPDVAIQ
jgi:hypothetical protein